MINVGIAISTIKSGLGWLMNPENFRIIGLIIVLGMGTGLVYQHREINDLEQENSVAQSNIDALNSQIETTQRKNGFLLGEKGALQAELGDLRELNSDLAEQVEDLENNPITITEVVVETRVDTIVDIPTAGEYLGEDRFRLTWEYENSGDWGSRLLRGTNEFNILGGEELTGVQTDILADQFSLRLRTGFRETGDGRLRVYVETDYPNIDFTSIEGAIVDKDYFLQNNQSDGRNWVIGPQVGVGIGSNSKITPTIGIGVTYNVWGWD